MEGITASKRMHKTERKAGLMAKEIAKQVPAVQPIELDCADEGFALEMARWLTHLRAERRLSPKTTPVTSANASFSLASTGAGGSP
jgi:hypothetical protein